MPPLATPPAAAAAAANLPVVLLQQHGVLCWLLQIMMLKLLSLALHHSRNATAVLESIQAMEFAVISVPCGVSRRLNIARHSMWRGI